MKKLPIIALVAAVAAFAILSVSLTAAVSVFATAGILNIAFVDYNRPVTGFRAAMVPAQRSERLGLAA